MTQLRIRTVAGQPVPPAIERLLEAAGRLLASPAIQAGQRLGYVVRGLLYGAMGLSALSLALGRTGHGADQKGSLPLAVTAPGAWLLLSVLAVGLAAYSSWGFVRAVYDPLRRGDDVPGLVQRLGFAWSGVAYAALLVVVFQVLIGNAPDLHEDTVQDLVRRGLQTAAGTALTFAAGGVGLLAGLGQFWDAWHAGFRRDLEKRRMERAEYATAVWLGRVGLFSRGVVFMATGWFVLLAAYHRDFQLARGFGAAFDGLAEQPLGHLVVGVLGAGFVALALHSIECARWIRFPDPPAPRSSQRGGGRGRRQPPSRRRR